MSDDYKIKDNVDETLLNEPTLSWGGPWTEQKLDTFEKYVNAYLTIMNKHRDEFGWKLVYFDGFAGSGSRYDGTGNTSELLLDMFDDQSISKEEISVYKGAAERILNIEQRGFDYYYFIDNDEEANKQLEEKLSSFKSEGKSMAFRNSDANEEINKLAWALHNKKVDAALVLLDPFGMQVKWNVIQQLKNTHTDLWILIPSGVIINRLLDRKGNILCKEKLSSFFGMSETEIKDYFYHTKTDNTLFGEETIVEKVQEPIKRIAELYIRKLKTIFSEVTEEPLVMYNRKHTPIYHFVFASNNKSAKKIAKQIINKNNRHENY